jgi:hypothetical protein
MNRRQKQHHPILLLSLIGVFLVLPPILFCQNLPTVCNIFLKKKFEASGPCGKQNSFLYDQSWEKKIFSTLFFVPTNIGFNLSPIAILTEPFQASFLRPSPPFDADILSLVDPCLSNPPSRHERDTLHEWGIVGCNEPIGLSQILKVEPKWFKNDPLKNHHMEV